MEYQTKISRFFIILRFFGSIKCFKYLLIIGFEINEKVMSMVVCNGSFNLFHLCQNHRFLTINQAYFASEFFHLLLLAFIMENGVDVSNKCKNNFGSIHIAASSGHLCIVQCLVSQKADISAQSSGYPYGTPLHLAAENGHLSVVEYLVNQKADINAKNNYDWTPLHLAARNGHLSVVEYLVNQKADINAKNTSVEFLYLMRLLFI